MLFTKGDLEQAEEALVKAYHTDNNCESIESDLAMLKLALGRKAEAEVHYQKAMGKAADYANQYITLAQYALIALGDEELANQYCVKALELDDHDPENWAMFSALMEKLGSEGEACEAEQMLLSMVPDREKASTMIANALMPVGLKPYFES